MRRYFFYACLACLASLEVCAQSTVARSYESIMESGSQAMVLKDYRQAIQHYTEALALKPASGLIHFRLGQAYQGRLWQKRAEMYYLEAISHGYASTQLYHSLASVQISQGKYREAITFLDKALVLDQDNATLLLLKGMCCLKVKELAQALGAYQKILTLDDTNVQALEAIAKISRAVFDFAGGLKVSTRLTQLHPDKASYWLQRGMFEAKLDRTLLAIDSYTKALDRESHNAEVLVARAGAYQKVGNLRSHFEDLGYAYFFSKKYEKATLAFESYTRQGGEKIDTIYLKGICYEKLGKYQMAVDSYDLALEEDAEYAEVWLSRSFAISALGETREALRNAKTCRDLAKDQDDDYLLQQSEVMIQTLRTRLSP